MLHELPFSKYELEKHGKIFISFHLKKSEHNHNIFTPKETNSKEFGKEDNREKLEERAD